ncbi:MAG: AMP-binding protein [Deltaproteobacteria bacterium]|nr:AMP-binding protein [Deltaproteobacteria bacterium]
MLFDRAARDPAGLALDDLTRRRSWQELADRSVRVARFLRDDAGLAPDDHVAVLMENRVECIELILGAIMAGVWLTPLNWHLREDEIAYVVGDSHAKVLFSSVRFEETARRVMAGQIGGGVVLAGDELDAALASASDVPMDESGPAGGNMIYTSGTTGRPKGVKRARPPTVGSALENLAHLGSHVGLDGSGPHLITGPMYHAAPLMFAVYDNAGGAPIVIQPHWDERDCLALLQEREVAHVHLVPTMFVRLLRLPEDERAAFHAPALEACLHGAAPVAVSIKERMIEWWGEILIEYWGGTEGGVNTLATSREWLEHPGTVGRALPGFEIFAVDESGERLPTGERGDLYCRHPNLDRPFEYHGDPRKTERAYLAPGVFTIGDIGSVDEEGWVFLADRKSNMIISGGVNIYPLEIEQVIGEHPAVADVGVFGVPDDEWGESVKAAVELSSGHTPSPALEADILAFARERLAGYKVPRSIDFEDELPRHESGKLYIRHLRDRYWPDRERRIG